MNELDETLTEMNFDFLGNGDHAMSVDGMRKTLGNEHFVFLDVRTDKEKEYSGFPFAIHIPLHELPGRLAELPKDKCIVAFCSSIFRGAVAYTYLRANGFDEVKGVAATMEEMIGAFKPGPLAKMQA
ncbi:rhodanese-like domain-containing protein [Desulforhopalus sp. IMCC35007]|uniref:rhodanese-like domain-containing protein n=1 Tax=Desulforhopalus sp. IMCC35007 TaxID=2569543 RepID=UPI0010AE629E|nr:rhodanese-like domain-containing protein [Desulforhopalus sp. IMCC35007]TKB10433.1 rhodanese-like domain-containing protein [Desulforhopalus sp. IMCC35007]